ncbi:hypothetical protein T552_00045 [Pneumocystis carinii B80]|uniref:Multifunctional methyltransferase subunit TRM112 n=1 Tax=Pneumocystis carinii (strain B80) TaxID=1408658 RepID=A0A0W4ZSP2_PNEC8|nr:hypothetical protein T552_00045 [Pneumocystis carinii B80]KTW31400.1 hypothetical protein T552_00045 [Pneumocystis carinii B80]
MNILIFSKTANFLQCVIKKCQSSAKSYPLRFENAHIVQKTLEFNPEFLLNIISRVDWKAFILTLEELFGKVTVPYEKPELTMEEVDLLQELHKLLIETQVMEGNLICRNCNHVYPIKQGIPNFLLSEYEI